MIIKNVVKITYSIHGICFKNKKDIYFLKKKNNQILSRTTCFEYYRFLIILIVIFEEMAVFLNK